MRQQNSISSPLRNIAGSLLCMGLAIGLNLSLDAIVLRVYLGTVKTLEYVLPAILIAVLANIWIATTLAVASGRLMSISGRWLLAFVFVGMSLFVHSCESLFSYAIPVLEPFCRESANVVAYCLYIISVVAGVVMAYSMPREEKKSKTYGKMLLVLLAGSLFLGLVFKPVLVAEENWITHLSERVQGLSRELARRESTPTTFRFCRPVKQSK